MAFEGDKVAGSKLYRLGIGLWGGDVSLSSLNTAQDLSERAVEHAQSALDGRVALIFMMNWRMRMPHGMRDGSLLCKQQEEYATEVREPALSHGGG